MTEPVLLALAGIVVLGVSAQWLAVRLTLPSILILLAFGLAVGPGTGWLRPDELFGKLLFPLVSLSVALILYEGGLTLRFAELARGGAAVRNLISIGAAVTWAGCALAAYWVFGLPAPLAALLGAILVVTGPTVIGPLLRHIRPTGPVNPILNWEGIVIDPIGAVLAVLVFEAIGGEAAGSSAMKLAMGLLKTVVFGGGLGVLGASLLAVALHRYWIPDFLQNAVSLMVVVTVFAGSNALQPESGLLAVTVMGIVLANQRYADVRHIVEFKENLRVLLISALFVVLAARLERADLAQVGWGALWFVLLLIVVVRPLAVFLATLGTGLRARERLFLAWMAPRGIVAAAVSSLFALRLRELGYEEARLFASVTFITIIATVAIYGLTAPWLARRLGLAVAHPQGLLLVGAQDWVRALARLLRDKGYALLLVDTNRANVAAARMEGLRTYNGSILADHTLGEIDLAGLGRLVALTPNEWVNALAAQRFGRIFGRAECYQLPARKETEGKSERHKHLHGRWLFSTHATADELERRYAQGFVFKATRLSESFDYQAFRALYGETAVPMFVIAEGGRLKIMTADRTVVPQRGQTLISLVDAAREPPRAGPT